MIKIDPKNRKALLIVGVLFLSVFVVLYSQLFSVATDELSTSYQVWVHKPVSEYWISKDPNNNIVTDQIVDIDVRWSINSKTVSNPSGIDFSKYSGFDSWVTDYFVVIRDSNGIPLEGKIFRPSNDAWGHPKQVITDIMFLPEYGTYFVDVHLVFYVEYMSGSSWVDYSFTIDKSVEFVYRDPSDFPPSEIIVSVSPSGVINTFNPTLSVSVSNIGMDWVLTGVSATIAGVDLWTSSVYTADYVSTNKYEINLQITLPSNQVYIIFLDIRWMDNSKPYGSDTFSSSPTYPFRVIDAVAPPTEEDSGFENLGFISIISLTLFVYFTKRKRREEST